MDNILDSKETYKKTDSVKTDRHKPEVIKRLQDNQPADFLFFSWTSLTNMFLSVHSIVVWSTKALLRFIVSNTRK